MITIQAKPKFINFLRVFFWDKKLEVNWDNFLDYCRFSNYATVYIEGITIISLKTTSGKIENYEWTFSKPNDEQFPDELIKIMEWEEFDLEDLSKIKKDKISGKIFGTYSKILN